VLRKVGNEEEGEIKDKKKNIEGRKKNSNKLIKDH
jgi:hypothetical protein